MSEKLATRDEVERFKAYIEIAKYAISINIALAAVAGVLLKLASPDPSTLFTDKLLFGIGIFYNIGLFVVCHRLVSDATRAITHEMEPKDRQAQLVKINSGIYSLFAIVFLTSLLYWSVVILVVAI